MKKLRDVLDKIFAHKRFNLIAFCIIAVMVLIAYSNTFTASFHFDDNPAIVENHYIRHVTWDNIRHLVQSTRPVVMLSLMLNYQLSELNVIGWHVFNITNHIVNSWLVYMLFLWTLSMPLLFANYGDKVKRMALFGALLFAVHPVQTESVTYIITRTELLATFFYLLTILLFIQYSRKRTLWHPVVMAVTSLLAMESKEWAVTLPAVVLLYDYLFISGGRIRDILSRWYVFVLMALPWAIVLSKLSLFSVGQGGSYGFSVSTTTGITPWTYLLTSLNVLWTYIRLLILPINQNLDYDYPIAKTLFALPTILSFIGHLAVVALAVWGYARKRWVVYPFGVAWFYVTLSPVQSFVPLVDVIFEHRLYMPSIGFFIVFVAAYEGVFDWIMSRDSMRKGFES